MIENQSIEKKSIKLIIGNNADWDKLAKECIGFANANGGNLLIGIEDNSDEAPASQVIDNKMLSTIRKKVMERTVNVNLVPIIKKSINGGEYIELKITRNIQTIASTSDGKYYIRIADSCQPVLPDELQRLFADKNAFVWEEQTSKKILKDNFDNKKLNQFISNVRESNRVNKFIKEKSVDEILEYYLLP
ncbi:MAG: putative transcriptional regulator [Ignavibacteria bacterium]|nr:putative transcriptional regulator [Ignavibacteria bacterium]